MDISYRRVFQKHKLIILILIILVILRIALPIVVLKIANHTLENMDGYYGQVEDVDFALYKGAYSAQGVSLNKIDSATGEHIDFLYIANTEFSIQWDVITKGFVGKLKVHNPTVTLTEGKMEIRNIIQDSTQFIELKNKALPLKLNKAKVHNATIKYINNVRDKPFDILIHDIHVVGTNLRQVNKKQPSSLLVEANFYDGKIRISVDGNLLQKPNFKVKTIWNNTDLAQLNDVLTSYANFDVNKGSFSLSSDITVRNHSLNGHIKPVIKNLDITGKEDKSDGLLQKGWEVLLGGVAQVIEHPKSQKIATEIPVDGKLSDPDINAMYAIGQLLRNAFIKSIDEEVANTLDTENKKATSVEKDKEDRNFFERVFGL